MPGKLGILAGGGTLPRRIIEACRAEGRAVFLIAFEGQADTETVGDVEHAWVRLGAAGSSVKMLHSAGVEEIVMAGSVKRPSLVSLRPDWWATRFFARSGAFALGDDGLLSALVRELETREGFRVIGLETLLPGIKAQSGPFGEVAPDDQALRDIRRGFDVIRGLGFLDIGQASVIQQSIVLAVEAIEGTDAMLSRCGPLQREGAGGVLVKARKPGQEERADLPTIGATTIKNAAAAGLRGVAVEADGVLVIDQEAVTRAADKAGLFVFGFTARDVGH